MSENIVTPQKPWVIPVENDSFQLLQIQIYIYLINDDAQQLFEYEAMFYCNYD